MQCILQHDYTGDEYFIDYIRTMLVLTITLTRIEITWKQDGEIYIH